MGIITNALLRASFRNVKAPREDGPVTNANKRNSLKRTTESSSEHMKSPVSNSPVLPRHSRNHSHNMTTRCIPEDTSSSSWTYQAHGSDPSEFSVDSVENQFLGGLTFKEVPREKIPGARAHRTRYSVRCDSRRGFQGT